MEQVILAPDEEWLTYIAKMWLLGRQISIDILGEEIDGTLADLAKLQSIIDSNQISSTATQELQSLGIVLGKVFVETTPDYDWWVVEDEYGKDPCIRYKETNLLIFPLTMISKRIEDGEHIEIISFFNKLQEELCRIQKENYSGT